MHTATLDNAAHQWLAVLVSCLLAACSTPDPSTPQPGADPGGVGGAGGGATRPGNTGVAGSGGAGAGNAASGAGGGLGVSDAGVGSSMPACDFEGTRCADGEALLCENGAVVARQVCHLNRCENETRCVAPGAPSGLGSVAAGQSAASGCDVFEPNACGLCLNENCCTSATACWANAACVDLLDCLALCGDVGCESGCALTHAAGMDAFLALLDCAERGCQVDCASDPCAAFPFDWGYACGANLSPSADPRVLFLCAGETTAGAVLCAAGCSAGALNEPDFCVSDDPCANNPFDGFACGSNLATPDADSNLFYQCQGQRTVGTQACTNCIPAPPGSADICL